MTLLAHTPRFDTETAVVLSEKIYGIRAKATPLPSERDQNFLLASETGERFVLKLANELEDRALLEAQNKVMDYLASRLTFCPRVVHTLSGEQMAPVKTRSGATNLVRLLTYLPGSPLAQASRYSRALLRDFGRKLGQLDRALAEFEHPAFSRDFHWDLANGLRIIDQHGALVRDLDLLELVYRCRNDFERHVLPLLPKLRRSVIHNDANDYNVLVDKTDSEYPVVVGLIDFGDMLYSYTVGELAVSIAYVLLSEADPLKVAGQIIAGYHAEFPLNEDEVQALYGLVLMRLCMSVCLAAYQQKQKPDNEYLEISQCSIASRLPKLAAIDYGTAAASFHYACMND